MWGHRKPNRRWIKMREEVAKTCSSRYIVLPCGCILQERGPSRMKLSFLEGLSTPFPCKVVRKEEMYRGGGHGEAFSPRDTPGKKPLTGWGVGINHATAVSGTGACLGLRRVVVRGPSLTPHPRSPIKMCHLNKLRRALEGSCCLELLGDCERAPTVQHTRWMNQRWGPAVKMGGVLPLALVIFGLKATSFNDVGSNFFWQTNAKSKLTLGPDRTAGVWASVTHYGQKEINPSIIINIQTS